MTRSAQTPLHHQPNRDLLQLMPAVPRLVEAGCSSGALAAAYKAQHLHCRYTGIEIDPAYAEVARQHCDAVLVADLDALASLPVAEALRAECWVFGDCLEHLVDPWAVLRWVHAHQPDQGLICACIPNSQHWSLQARLSCGAWSYEASGLLDRTHLRFFTASTIPALFEQAGYRIRTWQERHVSAQPSVALLQSIGALAAAAGADADQARAASLPFQYLVVAERQSDGSTMPGSSRV